MDEQVDAIPVPHAFGPFPLNVGATILPLIWGIFHGVGAGVVVQLVVGAAFVGASIASKQTGSAWPAVALGLRIVGAAISVGFGLVADRLAWRTRRDRDPARYAKSERLWAIGIVVYALFATWYRSNL